ncbi:hypothetical protein GCM10023216_10730 [Isoptericola chiayiensis]|uniref:Uncharacterized protein n=1 Tax=Isoptericola chiayiensis TaxID=579446 RepID=A0ABP8Y8P5_9MICO|nr:hypothetical protein [Isoptericola chiayiensis]NOW00710.1 hypothetical protein [Isoptericola chiayiensis]
MTRLVLLPGRDTGGLDPERLEAAWLAALNTGLAEAGSALRLADADAEFVFYGDTLDAVVGRDEPPPITTHGLPGLSEDAARFALSVARQVLTSAGVPTAEPSVAPAALTGGSLWAALSAALAAIDRWVPDLSSAVLLLFVRDVYVYLTDAEARATIDAGVAAAIAGDGPAVIVAHSLGSVIAYDVLRSTTPGLDDVPLLVTLGSPLAIAAVRDAVEAIAPLTWPAPVERWVALRDPRDLLTLRDLDADGFPLPGPLTIENADVVNPVPGHHAAATVLDNRPAGYAAVPEVGRLLDEALARP